MVRMDTRARTLAALTGAATGLAVGFALSTSLERHLVRGESMVPALRPRDTVISVRAGSVLGRFLRPRPSRIAVIELPCVADAQPLRRPPGVEITYLARNDRPRGEPTLHTLGTLLRPGGSAPAAGAGPPVIAEPAEDLYAWVAGEASVVREVRRALVGPCGLDRRQVAFMGYWRQGRAEG